MFMIQLSVKQVTKPLRGHGHSSDLLEQPQSVNDTPTLYDFPVRKSEDVNAFPCHRFARGGHALKIALVRPPADDAAYNLVPFGNLILGRETKVREGGVEERKGFFHPLDRSRLTGSGIMVNRLCAHHF